MFLSHRNSYRARWTPLNAASAFLARRPEAPTNRYRDHYRTGFRQAVQHLVALRHERIAFVSGPLTLIPAIERREAFLRSMEELRVTVDRDLVVACDHSPIEGERALERIMRLTEKPSAVVCSNDMTAIVMSKSFAMGINNSRRFVRNWFG